MAPTADRRRVKVCMLTSVHSAYDTRIYRKECTSLANAGYEVTLIAPHDEDESGNLVKIRALKKRSGRFGRMTLSLWDVCKAAVKTRADIYHFHDPELIPAGILLKLMGRKVIYDVHEDLPKDIMDKDWIHPALRKSLSQAINVIEKCASRAFDTVVAATPAIARRFARDRCVTVQNFPILGELVAPIIEPYAQREYRIGYLGGLTEIRGARQMVRAMEHLPERHGSRLVLVGEIQPAALEKELSTQPGWLRIDYLGWQSRESVRDLLGQMRMGIVTVHPVANNTEAQPTKLFEYMSAGIPVIVSDFPLWREIVEGAGCGLPVDPLDPKAIAEAVVWIFDHPVEAEEMGRRAKEAVESTFNWPAEEKKLLKLYSRLAEQVAH